jgi:hypothetical protein
VRGLSVALAGFLWFSVAAGAESPVYFADPVLKKAVEQTLWLTDPTPSEMLALTKLRCCNSGVTSLTGLEYATNLDDLSVLENEITDLSPLAGLTNLRSLNFQDNDVSDISALSGLIHLQYLCMEDTLASDISPLLSLRSLSHLDLRSVPLDEEAYGSLIPQIMANNPGIEILHDRAAIHLTLSAGRGGSVVSPGEGDFTFEGRTDIVVEAKADPGYVFDSFSGAVSSTLNPLSFALEYNCDIRANFVSVLRTIHVDDNAPADPGPANSAVSDPLENGTVEHPFDSIQEAIAVAAKGAVVFVHAGTYREKIDLLGKRIEVTGFDPNDPDAAAWPVIDGNGSGPVVRLIHGEGPDCVLAGLVITGGLSRDASAIHCVASGPTITNCLIAGNRATDLNGAVILCAESSTAFINCTIADNRGGQLGAGMSVVNGRVTAANSIFWGNWPKETTIEADELPRMRYTLIAPNWWGTGNLNTDPLFACRGRWVDRTDPNVTVWPDNPNATWVTGDYHLQSQAGRWDPKTGTWLQDKVTSPCVDGGDPTVPVGSEPLPNGGIINMGVYGGAAEASKSQLSTVSP